jgi:hypothetical protein
MRFRTPEPDDCTTEAQRPDRDPDSGHEYVLQRQQNAVPL